LRRSWSKLDGVRSWIVAFAIVLVPGCHDTCGGDRDCSGGDVCARDGQCLPAAYVRAVRVTWTVGGAAASPASCAAHLELAIQFSDDAGGDDGESFGFAPVPCMEGVFSVDRMPMSIVDVTMNYDDFSGPPRFARIGDDGNAAIAF
jgi:hypothetical protein